MVVFAKILQKDRANRAWLHGEFYFKALAHLIVGTVQNLQTRPESPDLGRADLPLNCQQGQESLPSLWNALQVC